jgi:hypothetical protein
MPVRSAQRRAIGVLLGLALSLGAGKAWADTSFALSWRDPKGCVTEKALRAVVAEKIGRDPFVESSDADVVIDGEALATVERFRARVLERRRDGVVLGSREIDAESCERLVRATGIVIALFVRASEPENGREEAPQSSSEERATETSPPPPIEPTDAGKSSSSTLQTTTARRPPALVLSLGVGGVAAVGALPSLSGGLRLVARLESSRSRLSFVWSGEYMLPQSFESGTVRGTLSAVDQQVFACLSLTPPRPTRFEACGGAYWGAVIPATAGVRDQNDAWRAIAGPAVALAAQLGARTSAARLELGVAMPVVGRTLYFENARAEPERLYSTGQVIVFLGVAGLATIP